MLWYSYMSETEKEKYIDKLLEKIEARKALDEIEYEVLEQYESIGDINPMAIRVLNHLCF